MQNFLHFSRSAGTSIFCLTAVVCACAWLGPVGLTEEMKEVAPSSSVFLPPARSATAIATEVSVPKVTTAGEVVLPPFSTRGLDPMLQAPPTGANRSTGWSPLEETNKLFQTTPPREGLLQRVIEFNPGSGSGGIEIDGIVAPRKEMDPRVERRLRMELDRRRNWLLENAGTVGEAEGLLPNEGRTESLRGELGDDVDDGRTSVGAASLNRLQRAADSMDPRRARTTNPRGGGTDLNGSEENLLEGNRPFQLRSLTSNPGLDSRGEADRGGGGEFMGDGTGRRRDRFTGGVASDGERMEERPGRSGPSAIGNIELFEGSQGFARSREATQTRVSASAAAAANSETLNRLFGVADAGSSASGSDSWTFHTSGLGRARDFDQLLNSVGGGTAGAIGLGGSDPLSLPGLGGNANPASTISRGGLVDLERSALSVPEFTPSLESTRPPVRFEPRPVFLTIPTRGVQ